MDKLKQKGRLLIVLFLAGCVLFNYPALVLFSNAGMVGGVPVLYIYIFLSWSLLIGGTAVIIERR
jgi:hypothetical protein